MVSSAKKPKKTAEESALERRQRSLLDEEIAESEQRFKALARGKLGRASLLSGAPKTTEELAGTPRGSSSGGPGSLLPGSSPKPGPRRSRPGKGLKP